MKINLSCLILFILSGLSSCVTHRNILDLQTGDKDLIVTTKQPVYLVQPGDVLDIRVSSLDPQSVAIFNKTVGHNASNQLNEASIYLNGYVVSDSGAINLPLIGNTIVQGLSINQVKSLVEEKINPFYKFYSIDVKLMNFRVTVLGEVNRQGTYFVYNDKSDILQIIGQAGGITDYGNRKRVRMVRRIKEDTKLVYLDITSSDLIASEFYYLQPNDVIYVEPVKAKAVRANSGTTQIVLGVLTFVIVVLNLVSR